MNPLEELGENLFYSEIFNVKAMIFHECTFLYIYTAKLAGGNSVDVQSPVNETAIQKYAPESRDTAIFPMQIDLLHGSIKIIKSDNSALESMFPSLRSI